MQAGTQYSVSHQYSANVVTSVLVRFTRHDGSVTYVDMGNVASTNGQWEAQSFNVTAPANADAMTVVHRINRIGSLSIDNFSVKAVSPYSNPSYMSPAQVQSLSAAGFEVGAHTLTHADLSTLSQAGALAEIDGSQADLLALGITPKTFVYPFGSYKANVQQIVASQGFIGARTVNEGFNSSSTDRFALLHHQVNLDTSLAQVQSWINTAVQSQTWLILTFHQVDYSGGEYSTTPEIFRQIANLVATSDLTPVKMEDGLNRR